MEEKREAPSDGEDEAQGTPSDPKVEALEAALDPEEETREAPLDSEKETKYEAGRAERRTDLKGPVTSARRKLTSSVNLPTNNVKAHTRGVGECTQAWKEQHRKILCRRTRKAAKRVCQCATAGAR